MQQMNPGGVVEEIGQTSRTAISALASNPVVLGLIIFSGAMLGINIWTVNTAAERWHSTFDMLMKRQGETMNALTNCVPLEKVESLLKTLRGNGPPYKLQSDESKPYEIEQPNAKQ